MAAACNLTIELAEPKKLRMGGETVSGTVVVNSNESVKCDGLELTSTWSTHGHGNIATGDVDHRVVFQGLWEANREYRYPFELKTASWPPTYYGTYLNVSHSVRARARVPWKSDPKAEAEFPIVSLTAPEDLKPTVSVPKKPPSMIGWVIGWVIGGIVLVVILALFGAFLLFLLPLVAIGGACYWFFRIFLPRQLTGSIECTVEPKRVSAGDTVRGSLRFTPKRNMSINSIHWTMTCVEKCQSGSGSDRKTYSHEILKKTETLSGAGQLRVGEPQSFEFSFAFPADAPPSLKFTDNELIWSCDLRIDIAKWPDWVKSIPVTVVPSGKSVTGPSRGMIADGSTVLPSLEDEEWFHDVLAQVGRCQNADEVKLVLDAVGDHVFNLRVDIIEHLDEPPSSDWRDTGPWILATPRRGDLEIELLWTLPGLPPEVDTHNWFGQAVIVGFDDDMDCILMRAVPPPNQPATT